MRFTILVAALAAVLTACGGGNSIVPPASAPQTGVINNSGGIMPTGAMPASGTMHSNATSSGTASINGKITGSITGGWTVDTASNGYVHVYVSSSTQVSGPKPAVGQLVQAFGSGSATTSVSATQLYTSSANGSIGISGKISTLISGGFTIYSSSFGYLHVYTNGATKIAGSAPAAGQQVTVAGNGSTGTFVIATSISGGSSSSGSSAMNHVLTADYLGSPWGSTSVSWAAAAPYLTWAETGTASASAIAATGIKTMAYVDPNRTQSGGPMFNSDESTYAHDCSSKRVTDAYKSTTQYVMYPNGSSMQSVFASYVKGLMAKAHYDALFEDDAGALSAFAPYSPFNTMPCSYTDAVWINEEIALNQASPLPVVINGLSGLDGKALSLAIGILDGSNTAGGAFEQCYGSSSQPKEQGWFWQDVEDTELQVAAKGKSFQCFQTNTASAAASTDARIFDYASFLLTYSPGTSVFRDEYGTPSGFHVLPETELVPLDPLVSTPSSIAGLKQPGGTYAREYAHCYVRGTLVGKCAIVVNQDNGSGHPFPFSGYSHTLTLSGSDVLDGGTMSTAGGAPPSTLGMVEAVIAFQ